jgi:PIN domain nuclease of toxin-antitoxin system
MNILLDTHIFLWYITRDDRIPVNMLPALRNPDNAVYLSVVSLWEMVIKYNLGKLPLPQPPEPYLPTQRQRHQIANLDLDEASVMKLADLPAFHRDPFDRMLICQAQQHNLIMATIDEQFENYDVSLLPI